MSDIEQLQRAVDAYKAAREVMDEKLSKAVTALEATRREQAESQSRQG